MSWRIRPHPVGQGLPRDKHFLCGVGLKPQGTLGVRVWERWGSGKCSYKKDGLLGGGGVAFVSLREENRFCETDVELRKKANPVLCHQNSGLLFFLRQGVCDPS